MNGEDKPVSEQPFAQVPLFASLPASELDHLAATLERVDLPPDLVLFREGEYGDRFYLVLDGEIEVIKASGTADERLLAVRGPGQFVGEMSLLNPDGLRTATVRTRSTAQVLEMTRADFDAMLRRHPMLAYDMARVLSMLLSQSNNATIRDLRAKNEELEIAYHALQTKTEELEKAYLALQEAQTQIIEKERLEHELQLAREIQESILPRHVPKLHGFDFGVRIEPARVVGGDFFDFVPLDGDRMVIVVGDVSGKGMGAAIFMALTRSLLRAEAQRASTPHDALACTNELLLEMNDAAMFATVLYGVLDRRTGEFAYVRAGHEMPLALDAHGRALGGIPGGGQPLGILPDPVFDDRRLMLQPGSLVVLYTDGVTDAIDETGVAFGWERFTAVVDTYRRASAQEICDHVVDAIAAYRGSTPPEDDITLVAVRVADEPPDRA